MFTSESLIRHRTPRPQDAAKILVPQFGEHFYSCHVNYRVEHGGEGQVEECRYLRIRDQNDDKINRVGIISRHEEHPRGAYQQKFLLLARRFL